MRRLLVTAFAALIAASCSKAGPARAPRDAEEARALALAPPPRGAPMEEELSRIEQTVRNNPRKLDAWISLGNGWVRQARRSGDPGFYLNAAACASLALDVEPDAPSALSLRALAELNEHRFADARATARRVLTQRPEDAEALGLLSDAELELGHFDAAAAAAQQMMDVKPNLPSYSRASYLQWLQGDVAGAKESAREAIDSGWAQHDVEPLAWVFVQAAMLFWHQGDYLGADAGFDQALVLIPDYAPALVGKGRVAMAAGDGARAAALFRKALAKTPLVETQALLADALEMSGDAHGAGAAREAALREGRQRDRLSAALLLTSRGESARDALALLEEERKVRGCVYLDDAYAWALYRAGRYAEAQAASDRARALGTQDARLLFHAGAIRLARGDAAGAELVRRAVALNPSFDVASAAEARQLLARSSATGSAR
jgi:tetratricopeptide (TPR) repeat protein